MKSLHSIDRRDFASSTAVGGVLGLLIVVARETFVGDHQMGLLKAFFRADSLATLALCIVWAVAVQLIIGRRQQRTARDLASLGVLATMPAIVIVIGRIGTDNSSAARAGIAVICGLVAVFTLNAINKRTSSANHQRDT